MKIVPYQKDFDILEFIRDCGPVEIRDLPDSMRSGQTRRRLRRDGLLTGSNEGLVLTMKGKRYLERKEEIMQTRQLKPNPHYKPDHTVRRITQYVRDHPGVTYEQVLQDLSIRQTSSNSWVSGLKKRGLVAVIYEKDQCHKPTLHITQRGMEMIR